MASKVATRRAQEHHAAGNSAPMRLAPPAAVPEAFPKVREIFAGRLSSLMNKRIRSHFHPAIFTSQKTCDRLISYNGGESYDNRSIRCHIFGSDLFFWIALG